MLSEVNGVLEVVSPMPVGRRVMFALVSLVPLIAPYELLIHVRWTDWRHPAFFFAAGISLGAICLSALLGFAAVAGLEQRMRFDLRRSLLTYSARSPLAGRRTVILPFASIERVEVMTHGWSDGPDTYSIRVVATDRREFHSGSSDSHDLVESHAERIRVATSHPPEHLPPS